MKRSQKPSGKEKPKTKVWALDTDEPPHERFEAGLSLSLYSTKTKAEQERKAYEKEFGQGSAWVVELDVK
jgi:hypothetical protein